MGLKSGSRDAGYDDDESEPEQSDHRERNHGGTAPSESSAGRIGDEEQSPTSKAKTVDRPRMEAIPYKLRREKVNEGREQVPYFLREDVIEAEGELQTTLEETLGENVYKSDYREAAMIVAQRNPGLVATVLREWGYDLER